MSLLSQITHLFSCSVCLLVLLLGAGTTGCDQLAETIAGRFGPKTQGAYPDHVVVYVAPGLNWAQLHTLRRSGQLPLLEQWIASGAQGALRGSPAPIGTMFAPDWVTAQARSVHVADDHHAIQDLLEAGQQPALLLVLDDRLAGNDAVSHYTALDRDLAVLYGAAASSTVWFVLAPSSQPGRNAFDAEGNGVIVVYGPGIPEGTRLLAATVDIVPTVAVFLGLQPPEGHGGRTMQGILPEGIQRSKDVRRRDEQSDAPQVMRRPADLRDRLKALGY